MAASEDMVGRQCPLELDILCGMRKEVECEIRLFQSHGRTSSRRHSSWVECIDWVPVLVKAAVA
jgi:hypothetical protein